jgi:hypothetical protein
LTADIAANAARLRASLRLKLADEGLAIGPVAQLVLWLQVIGPIYLDRPQEKSGIKILPLGSWLEELPTVRALCAPCVQDYASDRS